MIDTLDAGLQQFFPELPAADASALLESARSSWSVRPVDGVPGIESGSEVGAPWADVEGVLFGSFFSRVVSGATAHLAEQIAPCADSVDVVAVVRDAHQALVQRAATLGVRTLVRELHRRRSADELRGADAEERFADFVAWLDGPTAPAELSARYPALTQVLHHQARLVADAHAEAVTRTDAARDELAVTFGVDPAARLTGVALGQGDTHQRGRSVGILTFSDGRRVVYKPRSLAVEQGFAAIVAAVSRATGVALRTVATIDRGTHGFAEFLVHDDDVTDPARFHREMGALTGLLYLLDAWDIHHENVITVDGSPVVIDAETLMRPDVPAVEDYSAGAAARVAAEILEHSVCGVGTLPMVVDGGPGSDGIDVGALGFRRGQEATNKGFVVRNPGRDDLWIEFVRGSIQEGMEHGGRNVVPAADVRDAVAEGTREVLTWAVAHRERLTALVTEHLSGVRLRFVHHPTVFYAQLLRMSTHPDVQGDGLDRWTLLHRVALRRHGDDPELAAAEVEDLWHGDVPYFQYDADAVRLLDSTGRPCGPVLPHSPLDAVRARIDALTGAEVDRQLALLDLTFVRNLGSDADPTGFALPDDQRPVGRGDEPARMLAEAQRLADDLVDTMIDSPSGIQPSTWIAPLVTTADASQWVPGILGYDLYGGIPGIGLFLGGVAAATGDARTRDAALRVVGRLSAQLADPTFDSSGIAYGAHTGITGAIYAVHTVGRMLDDDTLVDLAFAALPQTRASAARNREPDLTVGTAGALAVHLSLARHATTEERRQDTLVRALVVGRTLVRQTDHLLAGGDDGTGDVFSGFAHGLAGIVPGLTELAHLTGDPVVASAAAGYLAELDEMWDAADDDWARSRHFPESRSYAWCHGSAGLLLGYALAGRFLPAGRVERQVSRLVDLTIEHGLGNNVTYCHGDLGSLDVLRTVADLRGDDALAARVADGFEVLVDTVLRGYDRRRDTRYAATTSLMAGRAGIGYAILRHVAPQRAPHRAPSVLWFE